MTGATEDGGEDFLEEDEGFEETAFDNVSCRFEAEDEWRGGATGSMDSEDKAAEEADWAFEDFGEMSPKAVFEDELVVQIVGDLSGDDLSIVN